MLVVKLKSIFLRIRADGLKMTLLVIVTGGAVFAKAFSELLKQTGFWPQDAIFSENIGGNFCCEQSPDLEYLCSTFLPISLECSV